MFYVLHYFEGSCTVCDAPRVYLLECLFIAETNGSNIDRDRLLAQDLGAAIRSD